MFGLDINKALDKQFFDEEAGQTWADYFLESAKNTATSVYALNDAAKAEGFTLSEELSANVDSIISNFSLYASVYGYADADAYVKAMYGKGATVDGMRKYVEMTLLSDSYKNAHQEALTCTDEELRAARQKASNYKYAKSWLALALPLAYCFLDAAGTFADDLVLETLNEDSANVAYELTFLAAGVVCFIYTCIIKKQKLVPKMEAPKYIGAIFETIGQLFYIYALASGESALAAPIIASYCMASVLWSRIFLKEKLSWKHYACIAVTFAGILIMGIYDM
jgi:uncharacterized membrane protein